MSRTGEDRILTVPNVISLIRILLIPVFVILLLVGQNIYAFLVFVLCCISDGIDGFIARQFRLTTNLGKLLDPIADRGLILAGSICLCILGRLPLWILILVLIRDFTFLFGGLYLIKTCNFKPKVIWLGKIATTFFYIGFAMLVLAWPWGFGLGLVDLGWVPGFGTGPSMPYYYGIWPVYIGILLNIFTSIHYIKAAISKYREVKNAKY